MPIERTRHLNSLVNNRSSFSCPATCRRSLILIFTVHRTSLRCVEIQAWTKLALGFENKNTGLP